MSSLKHLTILLLLLLISLFSPSPIHAQQTYGLSIDPPLVRIMIKPGKTITQAINVTNHSLSPITLTPRLVPFTAKDNQGLPDLHPELAPPWLDLFMLANSEISLNQPFIIPANKSQQLVLSLKVPENFPPQDIYANLLVSSDPLTTNPSGHQLSASIGTNLLITITQTELLPTYLKISTFELEKPPIFKLGSIHFYDNLNPLNLKVIVTNTSPFLTTTDGQLLLTQQATIHSAQPLYPTYILSNSQRELTASPSGSLSLNPKLNYLGRYNAHLVLHTPTDSYTADLELFFFPFKITLSLLIFSLILLTVFKQSRVPKTNSD
ncbi:hypothetical protein [Candidatus Chazhemtobacterium aquaticus]|uniref:DUF916 domain-containing protein n=1 Tax=Candidatus Chazhemtobacterium aquaticus TaxID=2715735 RepID=A0A857NBT5_9BACT|nr:hypothetical protein [Candidatus Chazhemtobacterium aquaticus]QHO63810.1 hypothetical protein MICH65_0829 [Candidatus Chazhemtobacterium aquaticus]